MARKEVMSQVVCGVMTSQEDVVHKLRPLQVRGHGAGAVLVQQHGQDGVLQVGPSSLAAKRRHRLPHVQRDAVVQDDGLQRT